MREFYTRPGRDANHCAICGDELVWESAARRAGYSLVNPDHTVMICRERLDSAKTILYQITCHRNHD